MLPVPRNEGFTTGVTVALNMLDISLERFQNSHAVPATKFEPSQAHGPAV